MDSLRMIPSSGLENCNGISIAVDLGTLRNSLFRLYCRAGRRTAGSELREFSVRHGLECPAGADLRQSKTIGSHSGQCPAYALARQLAAMGFADGGRKETLC